MALLGINSSHWHVAGTSTYRLRSSMIWKRKESAVPAHAKHLYNLGTNLQNQSKTTKEIYVPAPGNVFVQTDQSGAEAIIMAYISQSRNYRALVKAGVKHHVFVAMHLFRKIWEDKLNMSLEPHIRAKPQELRATPRWNELDKLIRDSDNWASNERWYFIAKTTVHSSNYGISARALGERIHAKSRGEISLSPAESKHYLDFYLHGLFPEIPDYQERTLEQVKSKGVLYNLYGYPLLITGRIHPGMYREAYSLIPQSTVGCITNEAFDKMFTYINEKGLPWILRSNNHDSYLIECPKEDTDECVEKSIEFITPKFVSPYDGEEFQMKAEAGVTDYWS